MSRQQLGLVRSFTAALFAVGLLCSLLGWAGPAYAAQGPCRTTYPADACQAPQVQVSGQSSGPATSPGPATAGSSHGSLSFTGFPVVVWVLAGAVLVTAGSLTVRLARRRQSSR